MPDTDLEIVLDSGWLCEVHQGCTCGMGGAGYLHEPGCGLVPIVEVQALFTEHEAFRVVIERVQALADDAEDQRNWITVAKLRAALGDPS